MKDKQPPPDWPPKGNVDFIDYSVRYREGLDLVLRNISLKVKGGEKVRIIVLLSLTCTRAQKLSSHVKRHNGALL